jgi:AcrR family transcriptional regulator
VADTNTETSAPVTARRRGRLPALDPETERQTILEAAMRVLRRSGFDRATLDEVLAEASLSTRAFYRHYSSKDELLLALYREEAAALASRLERLVGAAETPLEALEAWIDDVLGIGYTARRAARAGLLRPTGAARDAAGWGESRHVAIEMFTRPLVTLFEDGRAGGIFPTTDPERDARTIYTIAFGVLDDVREEQSTLTREEALAHVMRFSLSALGVPAGSKSCR